VTDPSFVVYKYKHPDPVTGNWVVWAIFWMFLALFAASIFVLGPAGILVAIVGAFVTFKKWPRRELALGLRYFVCGNTIAYYKNVKRLALKPGNLSVFWGKNDSFKLEQKRFPTAARKAHKITANQAAKFTKASSKIIQRVLAESPNVQLVGIDRKGVAEAAE
jgi:hypothetical protein